MTTSAKLRVLVIEDDASLAKLIQIVLQRRGYVVDTASDGVSGIEMYQNTTYDIALVDYIMPAMDGLEVLRHAATHQNAPPIIFMTGNGSETVAVEAMKLGAIDYITKNSGAAFATALVQVVEDALVKIERRKQALASVVSTAGHTVPTNPAASAQAPDLSLQNNAASENTIVMCAWTGEVCYNGEWIKVEEFLRRRFGLQVSHGISPKALARYSNLLKPLSNSPS
jgi:DNA-binding response OmpR family regulator